MNGMNIGRMLITAGLIMIVAGGIFILSAKTGFFNLGKLPGDINIRKENFSFHFPIVSSIVVSIILTVLLNLFFRK